MWPYNSRMFIEGVSLVGGRGLANSYNERHAGLNVSLQDNIYLQLESNRLVRDICFRLLNLTSTQFF